MHRKRRTDAYVGIADTEVFTDSDTNIQQPQIYQQPSTYGSINHASSSSSSS